MEHKPTDMVDLGELSPTKPVAKPSVDAVLRQVLVDVLGIATDQAAEFTVDTGLFGYLPELDSMAVATLLTELEDRLHIVIEDDEVDGELLETFGSLLAFAQAKHGRD